MIDKTIFVVDDNITNLEVAAETLEDDYRVLTMTSAKKMFSMLEKITPNIILLDIEMPEINGMEALKLLKSSPRHAGIPVIFLTALRSVELELQGFEYGAVDFISKPFAAPVLKSRVKIHIDIDDLVRSRTQELLIKTEQLEKLRNDIVESLADLIENRDKGTGGHIERVKFYTKALIDVMIMQDIYVTEISKWNLDMICASTKMHDIGKLSISDFILNKQDKLTSEEFGIMKTHVEEGIRMLNDIEAKTGKNEFLQNCRFFTAYHHEKWNGTGYPFGLKGEEIPLQGRIMAVVDVYDALTSERSYKKAFSSDEAAEIIKKDAGIHFDPAIVSAFYKIKDIFNKIRTELKDPKIKL